MAVPVEVEKLLRAFGLLIRSEQSLRLRQAAGEQTIQDCLSKQGTVRQALWDATQTPQGKKEGEQSHFLLEELDGRVLYTVTQRSGYVTVERVIPQQ